METFGKTFLRHKQEKKKKKNIASRYLVVYNLNTRSFPLSPQALLKRSLLRKLLSVYYLKRNAWRGLLVKSFAKRNLSL